MDPAPEANPIAVVAYRGQIRTLAELLLPQVLRRSEALSSLAQLFSQHPDAFIFGSLPGAGELLAPGLLAKFGDHRDRFPTAASVQALAGTCPVTQQSGKRKVVLFRRGCDREFRRIARQFAKASVRQSGWALAYWRDVRPSCRSDSDAYRRLANRWLAIIWKMWQDGKAYDETYHMQQRAQRRRPRSWLFGCTPEFVVGVRRLGKSNAHQQRPVPKTWCNYRKALRRFRLRIGRRGT
jgi:hypothetical protein